MELHRQETMVSTSESPYNKRLVMRNTKIVYKTLLVLPVILFLGCNNFFDVNQTPNSPSAVPPKVLLPTVLAGAAFANGNELNRFASTIMDYNYGAGGSPATWDTYTLD